MDNYIQRRGMKDAPKEKVDTWFEKYSVLDAIRNMPEDQKKAVRWFIDCGDDDFLFEGNALVHIEMRKNNIPHEYRVRDGGHTWTYWRESLPVVLSFVSDAFHQF
jgi:enterochelin esterase-like enzyme